MAEFSLGIVEASRFQERLRVANLRLATQKKVSPDLEELVSELGLYLLEIPPAEANRIDPYLIVALQQGVISALTALNVKSEAQKRSQLRVAFERMRQAFRDLTEGAPASEEESTKEVLRWLVDVLDVPQTDVADLLSVRPRTIQRWLSVSDPSEPHDEDALRVRILARIANHLRHGFSGPGVVAWLERPHPELKGNPPGSLLDKRQSFEQLVNLAAAARSSAAS
jgi:hypothetical protein